MATQITVRRPFADFGELRHLVEEMLSATAGIGGDGAWTPSVDVLRKNGSVILRADLPGIKPEEVKVTVEDDILTVSGEHAEESEEERGNYMRRERHLGSFSRSMTLPAGVKFGDIQSTTKDGVLEVTIPLPKAEEKKAVEIPTTAKES